MKKYFFLLIAISLLFSCAEVMAPSGGEKDVTPPKIKKSSPPDNSTFFDSKTIEIKFDEFIKFNNSAENIFISPSLNKKPLFRQIGKKLSITFQEELTPNTTYTLYLDQAIEDYNEGNKIEEFSYVFSTGSYIDSLTASGFVYDAFDNKPVEKIYILLYFADEDSILYKKPRYITKTDKSGQYVFKNLKEGKYKIAALEDKNLNLIFDQNSERIAFKLENIDIIENIQIEPMFLFENNNKTFVKEHKQKEANHYEFIINKAIDSYKLDISDFNTNDIIYKSKDKTKIHYWYTDKDSSSTFYFDYNNEFRDTINTTLINDTSSYLKLKTSANKIDDLNLVNISFSKPVIAFDSSKLELYNSDSSIITYTSSFDKHKLNLKLRTNSNTDSVFLHIIDKCFTSFDNKFNEEINLALTKFEANTSNLVLKLPVNNLNLMLELYNTENELIEVLNVSRETSVTFENLKSGTYTVRIYYDENFNSKWDSGLFHVKQFPEKVIFFSPEIELKNNFDKELDLKY